MDLSQQELPLTAYFSKSRAAQNKKIRPADSGSQSVSRPSKRRRNDAQSSVASPLNSAAGQSKLRLTTLQLPTPGTSARKCVRNRRLEESRAEVQLGISIGENAIYTSERHAALQFGASPSRLPLLRRESTEGAVLELFDVPLAMPFAGRHKPGKLNNNEFHPGPRQSDCTVTSSTTQKSRPESMHDADGHFPGSSSCAFSQPSRPPYQGALSMTPHIQLFTHSLVRTAGPSHSPIGSASSDPFDTRQDVSISPRDGVSATSEALDRQHSDGPVLPMLPVPSSQSQYLLHPDATPKRKRCYQLVDYVVSSQLQEEEELMLPKLPIPSRDIPTAISSPRKHYGCGERRSQRFHTLSFTPVATSNNSAVGPSCSSVATNSTLDQLSPVPSNSPRRKGSMPCNSPSCNLKAMGRSVCQGSTENNIPPVRPEDALTESKSDSGMLQLKMKDKLSTFDLPLGGMNQVSLHSRVPSGSCSPARCGSGRGKLSSTEVDSATEAESDTEIRYCVEQISKNRCSERYVEASRENTPPPLPVISPLVSPAKSRIAAVSSMDGFRQLPTRKGIRSRFQESDYPPSVEQHRVQSESLPSVVREFICMFPGDESYPADFPESLRI